MWPYTSEESDTITYGVKKKVKDLKKTHNYGLILLSIIPSVILIALLITFFLSLAPRVGMLALNHPFL
jgi:hypothetical protein